MITSARQSWRTVPMPPAIAELPRDKRGFPIPWVSEWSSDRIRPAITQWGQIIGDCGCTIGQGEPLLGAVCSNRQRQGMGEHLCGACGEELGTTVYFLGALHSPGFIEVPVHYECAVYAGRVCPGLITRESGPGIVEATGWDLVGGSFLRADGKPTWLEVDFPREVVSDGALIFFVAKPHEVSRTPLAEWLEQQ